MALGIALLRLVVPQRQLGAAIGWNALAVALSSAAGPTLGAMPLTLTIMCGLGFGLFQVPNNRNMFLSAPSARAGAAGGMQATARLAGQTTGGIAMSLLFSVASVESAPRGGLAIGAGLTLLAGLVSLLRVEPSREIKQT